MSSVKLPRSLVMLGVAVGATLTAASPAMAETIVVRASGPTAGLYAPGKKLVEGASVKLKAGDVLTILDGRGTRTLRGPGMFGTGASATGGGGASIASFIGTRTTSRARTGAVRSGVMEGVAPRSPNLWYVDVSQTSTVCVPDPANVRLWRPDNSSAGTLTITGKGGKATADFATGGALASWPVTLPVTDGASYTLSGAGIGKPVTITMSVLPAGADGLEGTASTLIARKCNAQLDLLIETVALPDPAPDIPG